MPKGHYKRRAAFTVPPDVVASNGHTPSKLEKLLEYHERAAAALRTSLELLRAAAHVSAVERHSRTINTAIVLDAVRANGSTPAPTPAKTRGRKPKGKRATTPTGSKIGEQRARSATFLDGFDRTEPREPGPIAAVLGVSSLITGSMVRRGYLAKKGNGYVRTAKEFTV
jgi:hypothetical protein